MHYSLFQISRSPVNFFGGRSQIKLGLAALLIGLTLGCTAEPQTPASETEIPPVANQDSPTSTIPTLSETGWGEIDRDTPFDREIVQAALPDYRVEATEISREGLMYPVLQVYDGETQVAQLDPEEAGNGGILRITIYNDSIQGPEGATLGMSYEQTPGSENFDCIPGESITTGYAICRSPDAPRVQYIYGPFTGNIPVRELPPDSVLRSAPLNRLVWLNLE